MRWLLALILCVALVGCTVRYAWNVDSKGTKTLSVTKEPPPSEDGE